MCGKNPRTEIFLYSYGMLSVALGTGFLFAAVDPSPFPLVCRWYFVGVGVFLLLNGSCALAYLFKMPQYPKNTFTIGPQNETTISVAQLLDDSQFVGHADSPIVHLRDEHFGIESYSGSEKLSSATLSSVSSINSSIFYYKETFV